MHKLQVLQTKEQLLAAEEAWQALLSTHEQRNNFNDFTWYLRRLELNNTEGHAVILHQDDQPSLLLPGEMVTYRQVYDVSGKKLGQSRFRALRAMGDTIVGPNDTRAHDQILEYLTGLTPQLDIIWWPQVPVDSDLARYLEDCREKLSHPYFTRTSPATPRHFIDLEPFEDYDDYLASRNKKRVREFRRLKKKLQEATGEELTLRTFHSAEQVPELMSLALPLSQKTWQHSTIGQRMGQGDLAEDFIGWVARHGWLRSYVLTCGEAPISFLVAFQFDNCMYFREMGYDPQHFKFSPGNLLWMEALEDLFERDRPRIADFGHGDSALKRFYGNKSHQETTILLVRNTLSNRSRMAMHSLFQGMISRTSDLAGKAGVASLLRRTIRRLS